MGRHLVLTNSKTTSLFRQHAWQTSHGISTTLGQYVGRWWCRFANAPKISGALPQIWSAKKRQILDNFFPRLSHSTSHMFGTKRCISKQKCYLWIYNVSPKSLGTYLRTVTFDPETAEIRSVIATHPSAAITLQPSKLRRVWLVQKVIRSVLTTLRSACRCYVGAR